MALIEPETKQQTDPELDIYFQGLILRGTDEEIKRVKKFICQETTVKIVFQRKDIRYMKISPVAANADDVFYSTP